jgi:hypothetical protein
MPNGWRLFLASYMIWLDINPMHQMSIPEFFAIYRLIDSKTAVLAFTVRVKLHFITIKQIYSNNKNWFAEFFYISGSWESDLPKGLPKDQMVPR